MSTIENTANDPDDKAFARFAGIYPHEMYAFSPERFWNLFHTWFPCVSRATMEARLETTRIAMPSGEHDRRRRGCPVCERDEEIVELQADNERLRAALQAIVVRQDSVGGTIAHRSPTRCIAANALAAEEGGDDEQT